MDPRKTNGVKGNPLVCGFWGAPEDSREDRGQQNMQMGSDNSQPVQREANTVATERESVCTD